LICFERTKFMFVSMNIIGEFVRMSIGNYIFLAGFTHCERESRSGLDTLYILIFDYRIGYVLPISADRLRIVLGDSNESIVGVT